VDAAVVAAFQAAQKDGTIAAGTQRIAPGKYRAGDTHIMTRPTDAVIRRRLADERTALSTRFTRGELAHQLTLHKRMRKTALASAHSDGTQMLYLDGGAENARFDTVAVNGNNAEVTGTIQLWASMEQITSSGAVVARPANDVTFDAHLVKGDSGTWKVAELDWDFAPGSEP
jgi:hypothetical protein